MIFDFAPPSFWEDLAHSYSVYNLPPDWRINQAGYPHSNTQLQPDLISSHQIHSKKVSRFFSCVLIWTDLIFKYSDSTRTKKTNQTLPSSNCQLTVKQLSSFWLLWHITKVDKGWQRITRVNKCWQRLTKAEKG